MLYPTELRALANQSVFRTIRQWRQVDSGPHGHGWEVQRGSSRRHHVPSIAHDPIALIDGSAMIVNNWKEDQRVNGTYKRADNGTRELLSLQVGRK
jgi:hypothetical protein